MLISGSYKIYPIQFVYWFNIILSLNSSFAVFKSIINILVHLLSLKAALAKVLTYFLNMGILSEKNPTNSYTFTRKNQPRITLPSSTLLQ